jgi:putative NIF3 family GTP cyclohydrolase 1 type 2
MSFRLAEQMGLENLQILEPVSADNGFGVVGTLPQSENTLQFLLRIKKLFGVGAVRYSEPVSEQVCKVAVCTGSGGSVLSAAIASGAEMYVSADFKYNHFLDATKLITIADIGHFESEYCSIELICDVISKKIPTFAVHKSKESTNPINYLA